MKKTCNLAIWDTAGEEKFDSLTNFYCRNARAALICYDITNYASFEGLQHWVQKITNEAEKNCAVVLVGNKLDLVEEEESLRKVEFTEAKKYADSIDANVIEASAKSGKNVADIFCKVVGMCFERQQSSLSKITPSKPFPDELSPKDKTKCCRK